MEAYALLACFVLLILFLCLCAVALVLAERLRYLYRTQARGGKPNIDPYVKRALDRANASSVGSRKPV
jgi:hypothetical protein